MADYLEEGTMERLWRIGNMPVGPQIMSRAFLDLVLGRGEKRMPYKKIE